MIKDFGHVQMKMRKILFSFATMTPLLTNRSEGLLMNNKTSEKSKHKLFVLEGLIDA